MSTSIAIPAGVPPLSDLSGTIIDGFKVVTASDMQIARTAVSMAGVRGCVGGSEVVLECAGPEVMPEQRKVERWAVVERVPAGSPGA